MLSLLALVLAAEAPQEPPVDNPYDPAADAQPFPGAAEVVGGIVVPDLRALFAAEARRRASLERTKVGQAYAASEREAGGPLTAQLRRFADAAQPEGPQGFQVLVFSQGYTVQVQIAFEAAPGALERLRAAGSQPGSAWSL